MRIQKAKESQLEIRQPLKSQSKWNLLREKKQFLQFDGTQTEFSAITNC